MLRQFQKTEFSETQKNMKIKKFKELNKTWMKNLTMMKEKQKDDAEKRKNKRSESLKMHSSAFARQMRDRREKLSKEKEEQKLKHLSSLEKIKLNNIRKIELEELYRKETEMKVLGKLHKISDLKFGQMEATKTKFMSKSVKSEEHISSQLKLLREQELERNEHLREKAFSKFATYYEHMRNQKNEIRTKKKKENEKIARKEEILEDLEKERVKMSDSIVRNLNIAEKRRINLSKTKAILFEEKANKFRETCSSVIRTKRMLEIDIDKKNHDSMAKQVSIISNFTMKEAEKYSQKSSIISDRGKIHCDKENQISSFYKRLDDIKNKSILKLDHRKQKNIYNSLKRAEEEAKRKKEEEEKERRNK